MLIVRPKRIVLEMELVLISFLMDLNIGIMCSTNASGGV